MARITWSPTSRKDLQAIRSYIARDAPRTADAFVRRIAKAVARLKRFPHTGSIIARYGATEIREIYCGNYRIIYRTTPGRVEIVTVRHGARLLDYGDLP